MSARQMYWRRWTIKYSQRIRKRQKVKLCLWIEWINRIALTVALNRNMCYLWTVAYLYTCIMTRSPPISHTTTTPADHHCFSVYKAIHESYSLSTSWMCFVTAWTVCLGRLGIYTSIRTHRFTVFLSLSLHLCLNVLVFMHLCVMSVSVIVYDP